MNEARKKSEIPSVIFIMESNSIRGAIKHYSANVRKLEPLIKLFYIIYSLKFCV